MFNPEQLKLVLRKGVFPYKIYDSFRRFSEDKIPDKKHLCKSLEKTYQ